MKHTKKQSIVEAHHDWNVSSHHPTLAQLLVKVIVVDGIPNPVYY